MDIKQFLENTKDYPDNTPVKIGETDVPLGSLRSLNSTMRADLEAKMKAAADKETEINTRQQAVLDLARKAQEAFDAAEEARKAAETRSPNTTAANPLDDPFFAPVKKIFDERSTAADTKMKSIEDALSKLTATVTEAVKIAQLREWQREYDGLDFGKRDKKPTRDELLKYAAENKVLDSYGIPSVRAAWDRMSAPDRMEAIRAEALEKGREEGRMEAMAARVPAPGVSGPGQGPAPLPKAPKPGDDVLGDLYSEALKDPELRGMINELPAGVI